MYTSHKLRKMTLSRQKVIIYLIIRALLLIVSIFKRFYDLRIKNIIFFKNPDTIYSRLRHENFIFTIYILSHHSFILTFSPDTLSLSVAKIVRPPHFTIYDHHEALCKTTIVLFEPLAIGEALISDQKLPKPRRANLHCLFLPISQKLHGLHPPPQLLFLVTPVDATAPTTFLDLQ